MGEGGRRDRVRRPRAKRSAEAEQDLALTRAIVAAEMPGFEVVDGTSATAGGRSARAGSRDRGPRGRAPDRGERPISDAASSPPLATLQAHFAALFPDLPIGGSGGDTPPEPGPQEGVRVVVVRKRGERRARDLSIVVSLSDRRIVAVQT
jgi:hypothetical protein